MIPILTSAQMREVDAYTIQNEPIKSIDLMERASHAFVRLYEDLDDSKNKVVVFAGTGNNGGDALAIARMLTEAGRSVVVYTVGDLKKASDDFQVNRMRLEGKCDLIHLDSKALFPQIQESEIIIDGLFGSGLSRPVTGIYAELIQLINSSGCKVFSIDMPSGLFADSYSEEGAIVRATFTISFQTPKLAFFQPTLSKYVGQWHVVEIGLDQDFIAGQDVEYYYTESSDIQLPQRSVFSHKGEAGRVLLVSGSKGKMGSTSLSARAAMRAGCGLLYVHVPTCGTSILQINLQEAIVIEDEHDEVVTEVHPEANIDAIAIGPGIGTNSLTKNALRKLVEVFDKPMVLDADALNILSEDADIIDLLPKESILTPHPGEFKRLVGEWSDDYEKLEMLKAFCRKHQLNMVLKGAFSAVCNSKGVIFFNGTGNPGLATAGSGDVLTGITVALLGQKLPPAEALKTAVYLQGFAADQALNDKGVISMIASDIIEYLPQAIIKSVKKPA